MRIQAAATDVSVPIGDAVLEGDLVLPEQARGIVLFAHGSGSVDPMAPTD